MRRQGPVCALPFVSLVPAQDTTDNAQRFTRAGGALENAMAPAVERLM